MGESERQDMAKRAASRGGAVVFGAAIGLVGLGLVVVNVVLTLIRQLDSASGIETDVLGNEVPPGGGTGLTGDLGLLGGDFSTHGLLITVTGLGGVILLIGAGGLLKWARR